MGPLRKSPRTSWPTCSPTSSIGLADLNHQVDFADLLLAPCREIPPRRSEAAGLTRSQRCRRPRRTRPSLSIRRRATCSCRRDQRRRDAVRRGRRRCGLTERLRATRAASPKSYWLSVQGIYRPRPDRDDAKLRVISPPGTQSSSSAEPSDGEAQLLHHKYHLPCSCFAFVGNASDPATWKLPFRCADGSPDHARLPKAIQAILTNYRGEKVGAIPDTAIRAVLERLSVAASELGRLPKQAPDTAPVYRELTEALEQWDKT